MKAPDNWLTRTVRLPPQVHRLAVEKLTNHFNEAKAGSTLPRVLKVEFVPSKGWFIEMAFVDDIAAEAFATALSHMGPVQSDGKIIRHVGSPNSSN